MTTSSEAQAAVEEARRVLLPPLRFAARDDFAHVDRLKGFAGLAGATRRRLSALPGEVAGPLAEITDDFDQLPAGRRAELIRAVLAVLDAVPHDGAAPNDAGGDGSSPRRLQRAEPAPPVQQSLAPRPSAPRPAAQAQPRPPARRPRPRPSARQSAHDLMLEPVTVLPGVGPARAQALAERDLGTLGALLYTLPRTYNDRRSVRPLKDCESGFTSVVQGEVMAAGPIGRGRGGRFEVVIDDGTGRLKLVFFRFKLFDMKRRFAVGAQVTAVGEVKRHSGGLQMVHPAVAQGERTAEMSGVWPVYPEVRGLHPTDLARAIRATVRRLEVRPIRDLVPEAILEGAELPEINDALLSIHAPEDDISDEDLSRLANRRTRAHLRLAFDEIFVLQLALGLKRRRGHTEQSVPLQTDIEGDSAPEALAAELLPFAPTGAQHRATNEILDDLARDYPMARLLQGDVGAGKTAVAGMAALAAVRAGAQVAIMAPTEILAEQHHATFQRWFSPRGIRVDLITGAGRNKARRLKMARLHNGEIEIVVGTHALLTDDVRFKRLGLCIIDEQHRFGVVQRLQLSQKGPTLDDVQLIPHTLVMTATPIPRSLALTVYGDLAVSVLDELPPGRTPVETRVLHANGEEHAWVAVAELIARGERAYVVFPLIEESEKLDLADATRGFEDLSERFGTERVAILHGRIPAEEREMVMDRFSRGEVSVLVSTTVIEVGVDVPEATCMIVKNAERFGLSQLHQLRGRVGRSDKKSRCFLIVGDDGAGKDGYRRLKVMEESNDGFRIAEEDLAIRGPGDFLGTRQHGLPTFAFADITRHAKLIERARKLADDVLERDPELNEPEHEDLRRLVFERFAERLALAGVG
jgi:ATP-dependent DNA helicase RecG